MAVPLRSERSPYHPISVIARLIVDTGSKDPARLQASYLDDLGIDRKDRTANGIKVKEAVQRAFEIDYFNALKEVEGVPPASKKGRDIGFAPRVAPKHRRTAGFIGVFQAPQKPPTPEERKEDRERAEREWKEKVYAHIFFEGGHAAGEMNGQELMDLPDKAATAAANAARAQLLPWKKIGERLLKEFGPTVTLRESGLVPDIKL